MQEYAGMERCIEYVALDWPSVIEPIREELAAVAIDGEFTYSVALPGP